MVGLGLAALQVTELQLEKAEKLSAVPCPVNYPMNMNHEPLMNLEDLLSCRSPEIIIYLIYAQIYL